MPMYSISFEPIVRPVMPPRQNTDRKRIYFNGGKHTDGENLNTDGEEVPTLEWSARATVETTQFSTVVRVVWPDEQQEYERVTHTQRIFSDVDPAAYIDVEVPDKISMKDERSGKQLFLNFNA